MRKLLLFLAGLLFPILPSSAQQKIADITTTVVTTPDELTTGYYIINCYIPRTSGDTSTKPSGSLYYNSDRADRPFCITRDGFIFNQETQITSDKANYIWYVNKTDDGNITIRNIYPKVYFPTDVNRNENMGNPEKKAAEVFAIKSKSVTDNEGTDMSGIVLTATSKKDTENDQEYERTVFANWATGTDPNLSYWSTGDGEIMFQFVAVQNVNFKITTFPFHASEAPNNENFDSNTKWQLLCLGNDLNKTQSNYLYYTDDNTNILTNTNYTTEDKYLWAFHVNEDNSIVLYNKAAGATKVLAAGAMTGDKGGSTYPKFISANHVPSDQIATWNALKSTDLSQQGRDGFYLYRGDNQDEKLNKRTGGLAFWTGGADGGSTFWVVPYVNYTIECVDENGTELHTVTGSGVAGTAVTLPVVNFLSPASATYNDQALSLENNNTQITLPEDYDCVITVTYTGRFFKISTKPTGSTFAKDTHWYYLKINSGTSNNNSLTRYAAYTEKDNDENEIDLFESNPINYGSFWAFVKTNDGKIQIYNAAAGTSKVLTIGDIKETGTQDIRYLKMEEATSTTANNSWGDYTSKSTRGYELLATEVDTKTFYINHAYATTTNNENKPNNVLFVKQDAKGEWSDLMFEPVDITAAAQITKDNEDAIRNLGYVGNLDENGYSAFTTALNKNTVEGLLEAFDIRDNTGSRTTVESDKYYRLMTSGSADNNYMTITDAGAKGQNPSETDASQIWKFRGDETSGYKLSAQGRYMLTPTTSADGSKGVDVGNTINANEGASFFILKSSDFTLFNIGTTTDDQKNKLSLSSDGDHPIIGWGRYLNGSKWYIIPATSIDVTISDAEYATVNYPFAVQLPKGLTAYTGEPNAEKSKFMLKEVPNGAVPANTPVVIAGTKGTYTLTIAYDNTEEPINSGLTGVLLSTSINPDDYILAKGPDGAVGFYMTTDGGTLAQNKAYIKTTQTLHGVRGFIFTTEDDENTTTGIESTVAETENEEYYDLQGRRVMNPTKGIYVTKSGKKVLFTK